MDQISRFVVWICSRFNREQIEKIIKELSDVLKSRQEFPTKPKDAFKQQHPNYREFTVDPTPPLTEPAKKKNKI
jgi:plasmid stabilization system protein ParE